MDLYAVRVSYRILDDQPDPVVTVEVDGDPDLVTLLGMLDLARDTVIRDAMSDDGDPQ